LGCNVNLDTATDFIGRTLKFVQLRSLLKSLMVPPSVIDGASRKMFWKAAGRGPALAERHALEVDGSV
jgi:hypothetical protein